MSTASAPGKIILFGEHAVVYARPALAVPVTQVKASADVSHSDRAGVWIEAPDVALRAELSTLEPTHPLAAVVLSVFQSLNVDSPPALKIHITSTIPVASGLGSGAAVSVAVIRSLSSFLGHLLPDTQVSALAYEAEKLYHGTPSGVDNTVITHARPVYFQKHADGNGADIEPFRVGAPFSLVIGDTGLPAPTKEAVGDVRKLWESDKARWEVVFHEIGQIVREAREAIESGHCTALGPLMDANQALLQELNVSSPELNWLVETARAAGAGGAKLSGGGRGGNMIALVDPQRAKHVAAALRAAGARRTLITVVG